MKKVLLLSLSVLLVMMSGCQSASQFYGAATGASLGGVFGSAIGGLTGGPRGHDRGVIAGMLIGGAVGALATAPKTDKVETRTSDYYGDYNSKDYQQNAYGPYASVGIENMRFVDENGDNCIGAGEHSYLVFEIRNYGDDYVYDIAPVISVSGTKQIYLSPTAIISELAPGKAVRYKADVVATKKLKNGVADFSVSFSDGNTLYTLSSFQLTTRSN